MADKASATKTTDDALRPVAPGKLIRIAVGSIAVDVAPEAGGRIAQITVDGRAWLVGYDSSNAAMIAWGSYPTLPWAGRLRHGAFAFGGATYRLPTNFGGHAIHGLGFALPWRVVAASDRHVELLVQLPQDERWPFGGSARQRIEITGERALRMDLSLTAGETAMPAVIGWHPWFLKPDRLEFHPNGIYPRDADGMAVLPVAPVPPGPWDDCFINVEPVQIERSGQRVRLSSDCRHWVVYDEPVYATCVEPQSGPPDAFNIEPEHMLAAGSLLSAWFCLEWS